MHKKIFIGDIHGCYSEFCQLLEKVNFDPLGDQLYLVGDLLNKGPHSKKVLELALDLQAKCVLGNHELGLLKHLSQERPRKSFAKIAAELGKEVSFWQSWLAQLPLWIEEEEFIVVHAGLIPNTHPRHIPANILTRIRTWDGMGEDLHNLQDPPWYELYTGKKLVIYGHWAMQGIMVREKTIGLDSGCVYGRSLSALILPERKIVSVSAEKVYCEIDEFAFESIK